MSAVHACYTPAIRKIQSRKAASGATNHQNDGARVFSDTRYAESTTFRSSGAGTVTVNLDALWTGVGNITSVRLESPISSEQERCSECARPSSRPREPPRMSRDV